MRKTIMQPPAPRSQRETRGGDSYWAYLLWVGVSIELERDAAGMFYATPEDALKALGEKSPFAEKWYREKGLYEERDRVYFASICFETPLGSSTAAP